MHWLALFLALSSSDLKTIATKQPFSGAVIVARNGRPVAAFSNTKQTQFNIASLGKMFTSVAIARLVEQGKVDFEAPAQRYVPSFPHANVTVQHLLTHTSGLPDLPDALFYAPPSALNGYLPFLAETKLEFEPGSKRAYSNSGFVLLGLVIESASGQTYDRFVQKHVFAPARMKGVKGGLPHGGHFATAGDLLRFFTALRNGRLLRAETTRRVTENGYGFGTIVFDDGDRLVGHSGGDKGVSADAYTYWRSGYTIVVLSNMGPPASHDVARALRKLIEPRAASASPSPSPRP